jgi:DNA-binding NarL/FixJ family response regulator
MAARPVTVVVVEDSALLRNLLVESLTGCDAFEVIGAFASAEEARDSGWRADALVADLVLPGQNGFELAMGVKVADPSVAIVLISDHAYPRLLTSVPAAYAPGWAYLLKDSIAASADLARAIEVTIGGGVLIDSRLRQRATPRRGANLTEGQWQILGLLAEGWSNESLADKLVINAKSVENALSRLYLRLGIDTTDKAINPRVTATRYFLDNSVLPDA